MMIHRRRIIIWIITVAIIVATLFGVGKFISYRTMVLLLPDLMGVMSWACGLRFR